jgi:hypothetical protein
MIRQIVLVIVSALTALGALGQQLFVNGKTGDDAAFGTKLHPLKTIREAARRANADTIKMPTTIILSAGVYLLTETVLFHNDKYSRENRLVLRAEVMPDDPDWMPGRMPVLVTVAPMAKGPGGEEAKGLQFELSHVTVEGLRFSGSPDYSFMDSQNLSRSYPIWREGKDLDDLLVTQCLFAGDPDVLPLHLGVIANGQGLVIDHCVFFRCKNSVVFWKANGTSHHNVMRYCLVYGDYFSGAWTTQSTDGEDFEFHHNVIAHCRTAWIRENGCTRHYKAHDCLFAGNSEMAGYGSGAAGGGGPTSTDFLQFENVRLKGDVRIEMDQSRRNYLQLADGSDGVEIKAGLFKVH